MRHFLDLKNVPLSELKAILKRAHELKKNPIQQDLLLGHQLAMIFEKPSTRTRFSFEVGINQLGGDAIVTTSSSSQMGKGETIADTARVLSRYVDLVMIRTFEHSKLTDFAQYSTAPVINGLTDRSHPCQVMADIMTFEEKLGDIKGKKVAWVGDFNNMTQSWLEAAEIFDFEIKVACPRAFAPNELDPVTPEEAAENADLITTDTWVSMGDDSHTASEKQARLAEYKVTSDIMRKAKDTAIFMHCLPAYKGSEVTEEVFESAQSVVFDEAENRLHIQKSIMLWCLEK